LCFLSIEGIEEVFKTDGTFDRKLFAACCQKFAIESKRVYTYPGVHSVWILDSARIHCDSNLVLYFRSLGIVPIFLPAYCPFYNPIEIVFGLVKKSLQRHHNEFKVSFTIASFCYLNCESRIVMSCKFLLRFFKL
jgi:hypothetical protein